MNAQLHRTVATMIAGTITKQNQKILGLPALCECLRTAAMSEPERREAAQILIQALNARNTHPWANAPPNSEDGSALAHTIRSTIVALGRDAPDYSDGTSFK